MSLSGGLWHVVCVSPIHTRISASLEGGQFKSPVLFITEGRIFDLALKEKQFGYLLVEGGKLTENQQLVFDGDMIFTKEEGDQSDFKAETL